MTANGLVEALRYGTRRTYARGDLGRYGLGLKTASLSQCRSVTVVTRSSRDGQPIAVRTLDLDLIAEWDEWLVVDPGPDPAVSQARDWLRRGTRHGRDVAQAGPGPAGKAPGGRVGPAPAGSRWRPRPLSTWAWCSTASSRAAATGNS